MSSTISHVVPAHSSSTHTHTMIILHGRDSIASEFASEFFESQASNDLAFPEIFPSIKWVFPTAKLLPSARFKISMSQWFDMWSVEDPAEKEEIQREGLVDSIVMILEIVRKEAEVVGLDRVFLGGISQGCATAIMALLCGNVRIGGFMGMCSWLPFQKSILDIAGSSRRDGISVQVRKMLEGDEGGIITDLTDLNADAGPVLETPIFLSHSVDDDVVPSKNGEVLRDGVGALGMQVIWKAYADGGHWVNEPEGVDDIAVFISSKFIG